MNMNLSISQETRLSWGSLGRHSAGRNLPFGISMCNSLYSEIGISYSQ